jgi:hypothetical protein
MPIENAHYWLAQPLLRIEGAMPRHFFGCDSVYARGMLLLVLSDGEEPWNGAFFPVERVNHAAVLAQWPELVEHPVLAKWLYLSAQSEHFETLGAELVEEIARGNPLFGVIPKAKHKRKAKAGKTRARSGNVKNAANESIIPPYLLK